MATNYISNSDGATIDPASESKQRDIETKLSELRESQPLYSLSVGPDYVIVTTTSRTLEEMGVTLVDNLKRITLLPDSVGIYWKDGVVTSNDAPLPDASIELDCTKDAIATREFVTASGTVKMQVVQEVLV